MISFKRFLVEKKMSSGTYAATLHRLADDALIGFEIEVFIPAGTFFHQEPESIEPETVDLDELQTLAEFEDYFHLDKSQRGTVLNDFTTWQVDKEDEWVEHNWDNYLDSGVEEDEGPKAAEKQARKEALRQAKNRFTWHQWFKDQFTDVRHFVDAFGLEPKYGYADDKYANSQTVYKSEGESAGFHDGWKKTASALAKHLGNVLGQRVIVNGQDGKYTSWNLTHDTSIKNSEGDDYESEHHNGYGIEIISPPLKPSIAMGQLAEVFTILQQFDIETNESTGIHVNISLPDMKNFDPLKLVLFMGDRHILQKFDRMGNTFTQSQYQRVVDSIMASGTLPKSVPELIELGQEGLKETGKYFSVNLAHLPEYLEFRAAGGTNYHQRLKDIQEVVGRWLTSVEIAADPMKHRREYLKKLAKLFHEDGKAEDLSHSEQTFEDILFGDRHGRDNFEDVLAKSRDSGNTSTLKLTVLSLFYQLGRKPTKSEPTFSQLKDARAFIKRVGVSVPDVLDGAKNREQAQTALQAFKRYKLA